MKTKVFTVIILMCLMAGAARGEYENKVWDGTNDGNEGDWNCTANWDPCGVPEGNDYTHFLNSSQSVTSGFDQNSITLAGLYIENSFTGYIGDANSYLQIGASTVEIGHHYAPGTTSGSGRIKLDLGTTQSTVVIHNSGTSADSGKPAMRIDCNNASTTIEIRKGSVGIGFEIGETPTIGAVTVSYVSQVTGDADVFIGEGVTLTTLNLKGGQTYLRCAATTINASAGELTTTGSGTITTLTAKGGTIYPTSSGTITTLAISDIANVDLTKSSQARTVTTCTLDKSGKLKYDPAVMTFTNKIISNNAATWQAN